MTPKVGDFENYFTCVGPTRSGTTFLHSYLRKHTTACMSQMKEISWFNVDLGVRSAEAKLMLHGKWRARQVALETAGKSHTPMYRDVVDRDAMDSDADYRRFFEDRAEPGQTFGDITPGYARLPAEGFRRIQALFPRAKVIVLLRNPAERLWSQSSRESFVGSDLSQMETVAAQLAADWPFGQVRETYARARAHIEAAHIKCIFTEDLFGPNPDAVLQDLCAFLDIEGAPQEAHTFKRNGVAYAQMPEQIRAASVRTFEPTYRWAADHMPYLPANWQADMETYL